MKRQKLSSTLIVIACVLLLSVGVIAFALTQNTLPQNNTSSDTSFVNSIVEVITPPAESEIPETEEETVSQIPENTGDKVCYLTFDDGPSLKVTSSILQTLEKYNAKATFFVVGTVGDGNFSLIKDIHEGGHAIGLHSNTHDYAIYKSEEDYFKDIGALEDKIFKQIGVRPEILRFPGGSANISHKQYNEGIMEVLIKSVTEKGYSYFDWNVGGTDANAELMPVVDGKRQPVPKDLIVKDVLDNAKKKDGDICVLMHDSSPKTTTAEALPEIIEGLREMGYRFEPLTPEVTKFKFKIK